MSRWVRINHLPVGTWVVADPLHGRYPVLAVWSGVRWKSAGPGGFLAQRWYRSRRTLGRSRQVLRFRRLANRGDFAAHGVPLGRPVFKVVRSEAIGVYFAPLAN